MKQNAKGYWEEYKKNQYEDITIKFNEKKSVDARYIEQIGAWKMNRLIEALPPIKSPEDSINDFEYFPIYTTNERKLSYIERAYCITKIDSFRIGRSYTPMLDTALAICLRRSYHAKYKNELNKEVTINNTEILYDCKYEPIYGNKIQGFSVIGVSGGGKTTSITSALQYYPQVIRHNEMNSRTTQITYIKVDCPSNSNILSFYDSCCAAIDRAIGVNICEGKCLKAKTMGQKINVLRNFAEIFNLGCIVIDEIQHLKVKSEEAFSSFLTFSNETLIPIIFVGTYKACKRIFSTDFRIARRAGDIIEISKIEKDGYLWNYLIDNLWGYQWFDEYLEKTDELVDAIFHETQGIIERVIELWQMLQLEYLNIGGIKVTPSFIHKVNKKYLMTTHEMIQSMDNVDFVNNIEDITYPDLFKLHRDALFNNINNKAALATILDDTRKQEVLSENELKNRAYTNITNCLCDEFSNKQIDDAYITLKNEYGRKKLLLMGEAKVSSMIVKILLDKVKPKNEDKKVKSNKKYVTEQVIGSIEDGEIGE